MDRRSMEQVDDILVKTSESGRITNVEYVPGKTPALRFTVTVTNSERTLVDIYGTTSVYTFSTVETHQTDPTDYEEFTNFIITAPTTFYIPGLYRGRLIHNELHLITVEHRSSNNFVYVTNESGGILQPVVEGLNMIVGGNAAFRVEGSYGFYAGSRRYYATETPQSIRFYIDGVVPNRLHRVGEITVDNTLYGVAYEVVYPLIGQLRMIGRPGANMTFQGNLTNLVVFTEDVSKISFDTHREINMRFDTPPVPGTRYSFNIPGNWAVCRISRNNEERLELVHRRRPELFS